MTTRLIGKQGVHQGKTLFEIAANLKNLGAGRVVIRNEFSERYPEKSYYILTKVYPNMGIPNFVYGEAWGYKVFRGAKFPGERKINAAYKKDWKLIPKEDEEEFCKIDKVYAKTLDHRVDESVPPLMELIVKQNLEMKNRGKDLSVKLKYNHRFKKSDPWQRATYDIDEHFEINPKQEFVSNNEQH